jgi:hypothetical protein
MSRDKDVMVYTTKNGWAVKSNGSSRAAGVYDTQAEAKRRGRQIAMNKSSELSIQGRDGKIREKHSYGKDPYPPRG